MKPQEFLRENEFIGDDAHQMHKSHQLHMLREECYHSAANAIKLHKLLGELPEGHDLDAWAAEKISLANDYLKTVTEWLEYDVMGGTNEAMMAGGMEAFSMESAERQYAELLGEDQGVVEAVPAQASGVDPKIQFLQPTIQFAEKMGYRVTLNPQGRVVAKLVNKQLGHIVHIGKFQPSGKGFEVSMADNLDWQTNAWSAKELAQDFKGWYARAVKDQDFNNGYNERPQLEQQGVAEGFTDTLKSVWRGLKAQVVDFAANAVGLPDDQRREVFVQAGNEFSNEVITLLANHPARDKLIPMIREIGGYMAKARTLKEFNSVMDKAGLFLADVEAIKFNPPSGVAKALPSYRDKQGVAEGEITRTATGTKHRSTAAYGGTEKDTDHLRTLDKATTNKIDKAIGVKFKKQGRGLDLGETTAAGSVSTVPAVGGGTLFGGNYSNSSSPFKKKSVKKESIIKR